MLSSKHSVKQTLQLNEPLLYFWPVVIHTVVIGQHYGSSQKCKRYYQFDMSFMFSGVTLIEKGVATLENCFALATSHKENVKMYLARGAIRPVSFVFLYQTHSSAVNCVSYSQYTDGQPLAHQRKR